jgi:hypothetical protein
MAVVYSHPGTRFVCCHLPQALPLPCLLFHSLTLRLLITIHPNNRVRVDNNCHRIVVSTANLRVPFIYMGEIYS